MLDTKIYLYEGRAYLDDEHQTKFMTTALKEAFLSGGVIILGSATLADTYQCATPIGYYETLDQNSKIVGNLFYLNIDFNPTEVRMATGEMLTITGWPDEEDPSDIPTALTA